MTDFDADVHTTAARGDPPQQHWDRLVSLLDGALSLPASERESYVRERASDARMLTEMRALLAAYTTSPGPLERVLESVRRPGTAASFARAAVGPYELLRQIGHGGMGVVYLARRADGEYQRLVALKLARAPVLDAELRGRFLAERDILAGLTHPNIAPLFDAGVTDDGLPYFTMEYVDGLPVDVYCDTHSLALPQRIRLFLDICGAVAAAHRALVVHRDLKPNNVLVTAAGDVKLVDFGIAKLLARGRWGDVQETAADERLMTPAYASPEQVLGRSVSTATDVYALGLLLYELLCGRRAHRLPPVDGPDLHRIVVETDPLPMAAALSTPEAGDRTITAASIARLRQTTAPRLARLLRGDLERIASMALRKDPDRRYATAAQLADDLARYLEGRPVTATGHSLVYRAVRFARRHRITLVAATITAAALAGYLVLAILHAREMERAAERERVEARRAGEVADFVVGLFEASDPNVVQDREAPFAQLLEDGLRRADLLAAQPQLQARLLNAIGRVYFSLGRYADAADIATRALTASRLAGGNQHVDVARDQRLLGLATGALGRQREAAELFRAALEIRRATSGPRSAEFATDQHHLGYALAQSGRIEEAERHLSDALTLRQSLLPAGHEDIAMSLSGLAFVRGRQDRAHDSVALYREALAMRIAGLGTRHPEVARARQNLASALSTAGGFEEAAQELTRALDVYRAVYGERHPSIATTLNNLGNLEARRRHDVAAVRHFRAALAMRRELLGPDHPSTVLSQSNLGSVLGRIGQLKEAEAMLRTVLARLNGKDDVAMGISRPQAMANLASVLRLQGRLVESEALAREALVAATTRRVGPLTQASVLNTLGLTLHSAGRREEATEMVQRALDLRRRSLGDAHPDVVRTRRDLDRVSRSRRSHP